LRQRIAEHASDVGPNTSIAIRPALTAQGQPA